jgi:hypothetical protein
MPRLAKKITVDLQREKLHIDGQEFPWYITEEGVHATDLGNPNTLPIVTLSLLAETIEVIPKEQKES